MSTIELAFLGTGKYLAAGRYWNSFVIDRHILVEPSPTSMPHLARVGLAASDIDTMFVSHFHPDHTYGYPFFALEAARLAKPNRASVLHIVGPPGVEAFLAELLHLGGVDNVHEVFHQFLDIRYVEVDGTDQTAGDVHFRAVRVVHVPHLECFGYLIQRDPGRTLGYSGDTEPCAGLDQLAANCDTLVLECNGPHRAPSHMDVGSVRQLRARFPDTAFVLTHMGEGIDASDIAATTVPDDFDVLTV